MKFHPLQSALGNILHANKNKVHLVAVVSVPTQCTEGSLLECFCLVLLSLSKTV